MSGALVGCTVSLSPGDRAETIDVSCRRISALVGPSTMHLARVVVGGVEVYPVRRGASPTVDGILECELRMRRRGGLVDEGALADVLGRLADYDTSDVRVLTETGSPTEIRPAVDTAA